MKVSNTTQCSKAAVLHSVFCAEPLQRPHFFDGRFLTAQDLSEEQNYFRNKQRRHNLHCHGVGVVNGLKVSTKNEGAGWFVTIGVGVAIDPSGNEVHLCTPTKLQLPESPVPLQVGIRFVERLAGSVPATAAEDESDAMPSRIEEGCEIVLEPMAVSRNPSAKQVPDSLAALPLARLSRRGKAWRLDKRFKVARSC